MKKNNKVTKVMHEWKIGTLHSGHGGPVVKSRRQAIAIALSEQKVWNKTHKTKRGKRKSAIEGK